MTTDSFDQQTTQPMDLDPLRRPPGAVTATPAGAASAGAAPGWPAASGPSGSSGSPGSSDLSSASSSSGAPGSRAPAGSGSSAAAVSAGAPAGAAVATAVDLRRLRLRAGLAVQVEVQGGGQPAADPVQPELQFLAAISGKGVMVGPAAEAASAQAAPPALTLKAGQDVIVRGFTGQHEFAFGARVLQTFIDPFVYALLSYPAEVQARQVRQAPRLRTALPAHVQPADGAARDATVVDLSPHGALLHSTQPPGRVDDLLTLTVHAVVRDRRMDIVLPAKVRHTQAAGADGHHTGVQFVGVQDAEWLVLQALCGVSEAG